MTSQRDLPISPSLSAASLGGVLVWACATLLTSEANAACVQSGNSVECSDVDGNGFLSSQTLTVHIQLRARIQNIFTIDRVGNCPLSFPAIQVGNSSSVTNEGMIATFGVCGFGIVAGRNSFIANIGGIYANDIVSYGILVNDGSTVRNSGAIATLFQGSGGIFGGADMQVTAEAGGSITTAGQGSNGIEVGARSSVMNAGEIVTTGDAAIGIKTGINGVVINDGSIQTSANNSAGIQVPGGQVTNSGRIRSVLAGPAFSLVPTVGVSIVGNEARFINTSGGNIEATHIGVNVTGTAATFFSNDGRIETAPAIRSDGTANLNGGAVILGGTALVNFVNTGTIISTGGPAAVRSLGAQVRFNNGGTIVGDVILSARDDSIALRDGSSISGTLEAGAGTDVVTLQGGGTLSGSLLNAEYLSKSGSGDWIIARDLTVTEQVNIFNGGGLRVASGVRLTAANIGNLGLLGGAGTVIGVVDNSDRIAPGMPTEKGTLTIIGAFRQAATGTIAIRLSPDGTSDKLMLGGPATFGGTLALTYEIAPEGLRFTDGQRFEIVTPVSSSLESSGQLTLDAPELAFLKASLLEEQNGALSVKIDRLSYATAAETPTQASFGRLLDRISTAPASMSSTIERLEVADVDTATSILADFAPESPGGVQTLNLMLLDRFVDGLRRRSDRNATGSFAWARGFNAHGQSRESASRAAYDVSGAMAGIDMAFGPAHIGLVAAKTNGDFARGGATAVSNVSLFGLTARYGWQDIALDANVAYGTSSPGMQRSLTIDGTSQTAAATSEADVWSASVEGSYVKSIGPAALFPHAGISYHRADLNSFSENAPFAVVTENATADSLRARLGVGIETTAGQFKPFGDLSISTELLGGQPRVAAVLIGIADSGFDLYGDARRRVAVDAEAGVSFAVLQGLELHVTGGMTANDLLAGRRISAGLTYHW